MAADEAGTLVELSALRKELIDPKIAEHGGRTVKLMGDGPLVEFASVVDALECAVAIQLAVGKRNAPKIAEDFRVLRFRLMVKRGPCERPEASEGEAQHGPFCWTGRIGQGNQRLHCR